MAFVDVFEPGHAYKVQLDAVLAEAGAASLVVGRSSKADITIDDEEVSRRHLELRLLNDGWTVEDLGTVNGTRVNGNELLKRAVLHNGDDIRVGSTVITYRDYSDLDPSTVKPKPAPEITKTERAVLKQLCHKYFNKSLTKAPATRDEMANALFVGTAAIQAHLTNLYVKFDIEGKRGDKRVLLAEDVIRRGVITRRDYPTSEDATSG
jgi:hypothetical protein